MSLPDDPPALPDPSAPPAAPAAPERVCVHCGYSMQGLASANLCPECDQHVPGSAPSAVPNIIGADRYCVRCGYSLQGLKSDGQCPECGTDLALSLREPTLASSAPEYVTSVRRGLTLVLNGILLMMVAGIASVPIALWIGNPTILSGWASQAGSTAITAMMLWGYWLFTQPDPSQEAVESQNAARRVLRISVMVQAGASVAGLTLVLIEPPVATARGVPTGVALAAMCATFLNVVAALVQFFAMMRYTRWMAGRVPDRLIVRRTRTYMWLLPILVFPGCFALFLGPLIALILYWNLLDRLRKHVKSIIRTGSPAPLKGALT